jgi:hypothetical protein
VHWRRGEAGSEHVGRTVAHRLGWDINQQKNKEMGGPFALDGRRLMGGHNNQPKVGINGGRGIEEERQPGRNVWGGVISLLGAANRQRNKKPTKIRCGLRRPPTNENHTTTNQKQASATKEVKEGSYDR